MILYNILMLLAQPIILIRLLLRSKKNPAYRFRLSERYGFYKSVVRSGGILIHAVSVGEVITATPLIQAIRCYSKDLSITVTTMTPTGSERILATFGNDVYHVYFPYDIPCTINNFLNHISPNLVIIMETELWPNFIKILYSRKIPVIIANARLSFKSVKNYKNFRNFFKSIINSTTVIAAQSEEDGNRFIEIGLKKNKLIITGNLKFDASIIFKSQSIFTTQLKKKYGINHRPVWIATSTHNGEEKFLLKSYKKLLKFFPHLLLILVPRHKERFQKVKKIIEREGFSYVLRSDKNEKYDTAQIVLGDTIGELMLLYSISDIAFIGGSLIDHGGHNPLEAIVHEIPILMGPYTYNFHDICKKLNESKGLITVTNIESLIEEIKNLLTNDHYSFFYVKNATRVLYNNQGALKRLMNIIIPYLPQ